ncbi:MAG: hypothetical protein V4670_02395 [Bacteroidota bacterium]
MKKKIIIGVILIFTIVLTYGLVNYIGVKGFLFAWSLNFMLMMCVFAFTETLKANFTSGYYKEKVWEHKGKIYENLGINLFRKLLVLVGWEKLNKKANPVKNNLDALTHLEYRTKQSELGHLIIFFIVLGFTVYVAMKYGFIESLWLLLLNTILNVYPILLQRYNRPRLNKAIRINKNRKKQSQGNSDTISL